MVGGSCSQGGNQAALGNADVAAVHCLSETIGGRWNLPHGLCNAIFLAPVLRYQFHATRERLSHLFRAVTGVETSGPEAAERMVSAIERLVVDLDIPSFASFGLPADTYATIAAGAVANNSNPSNARPMGERDG